MTYSHTRTLLLLFPLLLLHLHFGSALLHHHHDNSYYDHKDPAHHSCPDYSTLTKQTVKLSPSPFPSFNPILESKVAHVADPERIAVKHGYLKSYATTIGRPTASFPKRAPPA